MKYLFRVLLLILLVSCQPSKITTSWTANNHTPKQYKKILVLGIVPDTDSSLRIKMENHLADDLRELGYLAIAANKIFPPGIFIKGDTARAKAALEGKGFDGILTIVLTDKKKQVYYVPGKIGAERYATNTHRFDLYYNTVSEQVYAPGYYGTETKYIWQNNFYDLDNQQLIYTAKSRSFDYTSTTTLAHTYGLLMVHNLVRQKILLPPVAEDDR